MQHVVENLARRLADTLVERGVLEEAKPEPIEVYGLLCRLGDEGEVVIDEHGICLRLREQDLRRLLTHFYPQETEAVRLELTREEAEAVAAVLGECDGDGPSDPVYDRLRGILGWKGGTPRKVIAKVRRHLPKG